MALAYKLTEGGLQFRFQACRKKIQIFGGGFGNGKTTSGVIKALQIAKDYPGCNILIARATFPKLNDTVRKEFIKWCPKSWVESFSKTDNTMVLTNGSVINFRYIAQQGKNNESSTSNLLSATYDFILVDQMEDPEITHKDFMDLMGRLRGNTPYKGDDPTMPRSGPRWFVILCNPTRNWVYRKLVKPYHDFENGIANDDLLVDPNTGEPIMELFEGSTYENKDNLPEDFIEGLEATYKGQMRERFLMGHWGAFEGLVYPQYDPRFHMLDRNEILGYLDKLLSMSFQPTWIESYDHGIASPACYSLAFTDPRGCVFDLAGFYEKEKTPEQLAAMIKKIRGEHETLMAFGTSLDPVLADPAVFRRSGGTTKQVGTTVAGQFRELGIDMSRANNDIIGGINKVQSYLHIDPMRTHPITGALGSPLLFFCNDQTWIDEEITDYYWKKDTSGEYEDAPMDRKDHAMDRIKYMLTRRPRLAMFKPKRTTLPPRYLRWSEYDANQRNRDPRRTRHAA